MGEPRTAFKPDNKHGLILYDYAGSPCARRVRITLSRRQPERGAARDRHGERVLYDSQLIAEYLDHIYRANPLYPDDAYLTAQVRMWLAFEAGTHTEFRPLFYLHGIRPALLQAGLGAADVDRIVPAGVHPSFKEWLRDTLNGTPRFDTTEELARAIIFKKLDVLEDRLAGRQYLVGERFTMADAGWFTRVEGLPALHITLPPERYPNIQRWCGRVAARPSVVASARNGGEFAS